MVFWILKSNQITKLKKLNKKYKITVILKSNLSIVHDERWWHGMAGCRASEIEFKSHVSVTKTSLEIGGHQLWEGWVSSTLFKTLSTNEYLMKHVEGEGQGLMTRVTHDFSITKQIQNVFYIIYRIISKILIPYKNKVFYKTKKYDLCMKWFYSLRNTSMIGHTKGSVKLEVK